MNKKKLESHLYFDRKDQVERYVSVYGKPNFSEKYPQNKQRLSIFISLLDKIKPEKVVDAGCGAGMPLVELLNAGMDASGYDKSTNMVEEAKKNLEKNNYSSERATIGDFENPSHLKNESIDCITGMGAFYYANDFKETLKNQISKLKRDGHIIFSLRNKLFDLVTLNDYTLNFLTELYQIEEYNQEIRDLFYNKLTFDEVKKKKFSTVDDSGVLSQFNNPLTVKEEFLVPLGLELQDLYFYHYHALPPFFEHIMPEEFRKKSWEMENPVDWRGYFLASCFIVHCIKR